MFESLLGCFMDNPEVAAGRLLLGLGLGLLLVTALALTSGRLPPAECESQADDLEPEPCQSAGPTGWLLPVSAVLVTLLGAHLLFAQRLGWPTLFPTMFPREQDSEVQKRIEEDEKSITEDVGDAWAELEKKMLSENLSEEE